VEWGSIIGLWPKDLSRTTIGRTTNAAFAFGCCAMLILVSTRIHRSSAARSLRASCGEGVAHGDEVVGSGFDEWPFGIGGPCAKFRHALDRDGIEGALAATVANFLALIRLNTPTLLYCAIVVLRVLTFSLSPVVADCLKAFGALTANHLRDGHVGEGFAAAILVLFLRTAVVDRVVGSQRMILRALNDVGRGGRHFVRRAKTFGDAFSVTWAGSSNFNHGFHLSFC
jgi:hypothetical protein